jgi:hypothetical protein
MNTTVQQTLNAKLNSNPSEPEKELIKKVQSRLQNRDIFIVDDKYFVLTIKAMVGKILTVIDTHSLLQTPSKLTTIMNNPVRTILGASENTEIIADAVELYVRLPLLVEFYKHIFSNGNKEYKDKKDKTMSELEVIAFIPEIGTVWTGLIQCIFDESRYIDQGIYNMNNMKNIIHEINNIYKSYSRTVSKDKLVKTVILDLVAEVNRRYGILKEKDIAEFYQIKKKYQKFPNDMTFEESVNLDILDENNEYQLEGPSSMYVEKQFNKANTESAMNINDIKIRDRLYRIDHKYKCSVFMVVSIKPKKIELKEFIDISKEDYINGHFIRSNKLSSNKSYITKKGLLKTIFKIKNQFEYFKCLHFE